MAIQQAGPVSEKIEKATVMDRLTEHALLPKPSNTTLACPHHGLPYCRPLVGAPRSTPVKSGLRRHDALSVNTLPPWCFKATLPTLLNFSEHLPGGICSTAFEPHFALVVFVG